MHSKTVFKHLPIPFRVPQQGAHHHRQFSTIRVHAHQPSSSGSYDSEGDELLKEFQQYADPNKLQKITKRLELTWSVDRVRVFRLPVCSDWVLLDTKLHTVLLLCIFCVLLDTNLHTVLLLCRGVNLRRVTAVMGQASKSAHGAGAQVQNLFSEPSSILVESVSHSVFAKPALLVQEQ